MAQKRKKPANSWSKRLKALRTKAGWTQQRIALTLGISLRTLQNWEQGQATPPAYVRKMVESVLKANAK